VPYSSCRHPRAAGEGTLGTHLQLHPGFGLRARESSRGRFRLSNTAQLDVEVRAVHVEVHEADGTPPVWQIVLQDGSGAPVGTLELWYELQAGDAVLETPLLEALTRRQREILELVAEGCAVKTIASRLNISVKTVEFHKTRLMRRLGKHGTAELTRFAVASGLISI
jgi:DNA-binding CsgD family transcriptional regulator